MSDARVAAFVAAWNTMTVADDLRDIEDAAVIYEMLTLRTAQCAVFAALASAPQEVGEGAYRILQREQRERGKKVSDEKKERLREKIQEKLREKSEEE